MFTGLIKEKGVVAQVIPNVEGKRLFIESKKLIGNMDVDDSICVNGVCQTVVGKRGNIFEVQCVHTTLEKTTLGKLKRGSRVNLETALRWSDPMGGHLVQGHVNGVGRIKSIKKMGKNHLITFSSPAHFFRYIIDEGSITVDGVSLTVAQADREKNLFSVSIIPHTLEMTTFFELKVGDEVNVEVDVIAKYIENFLLTGDKRIHGSV